MADAVTVKNMPNSGSPQAVAFELWSCLRGTLTEKSIQTELELFSQCLSATSYQTFDATKFK